MYKIEADIFIHSDYKTNELLELEIFNFDGHIEMGFIQKYLEDGKLDWVDDFYKVCDVLDTCCKVRFEYGWDNLEELGGYWYIMNIDLLMVRNA
jgi:hypothetical protein